MKKLKHAYVTLIDLPEALPFGVPPSEQNDVDAMEKEDKANQQREKLLFNFMKRLEKGLGEASCFIGEDIIGEKFYKRFLFEKGGFVEMMTGEPVAISAHFTSKPRADKFAEALKKALKGTLKEKRLLEMLMSTIVVNEEEEYALSFQQWEKLKSIRGD